MQASSCERTAAATGIPMTTATANHRWFPTGAVTSCLPGWKASLSFNSPCQGFSMRNLGCFAWPLRGVKHMFAEAGKAADQGLVNDAGVLVGTVGFEPTASRL